MTHIQRVAFIGNHLPRRCGIATFTHDLHHAVATARPDLHTAVIAMTDAGRTYDYPDAVSCEVRDDIVADYTQAAKVLNAGRFDIVSLQHEYGIFGGEAGRNIVETLSRVAMPIVTTLHTVLAEPTPVQRSVMGRIIDLSARIVVMADKGEELLRAVHGVPAGKIDVIPHGIPDFPFLDSDPAKAKLGFVGKSVILTFGLLSPSKGIETVIDAMPEIVRSCPTAIYVVLGATHPNLVREQGEVYRDGLIARARQLGVQDHVVFFNQFVDQATLLDFISMCDVYVTPYLNETQMTSGTLAYSFGLGKAVVSTPYWHANELLGDGLGVLVPFSDANAIGTQIASLLTDDVRRNAVRERAYAASRSMTWSQTALRYVTVFDAARAMPRPAPGNRIASAPPPESQSNIIRHLPAAKPYALPALQIGHFLSMCDSTGLMQHAVHCVPDRSHGYCVDDNARALLFACSLGGPGEPPLPEPLTTRFAAFVQHAWNPDTRRFRNFMSYDRRWLEERGSEDSHGRTLWALAECARKDHDPSRRRWAAELFATALPVVESFVSPRARAFTLLGLDAYCAEVTGDAAAVRLRGLLADKILAALSSARTDDWIWFEDVLAYDNARLPQSLLLTGAATGNPKLVAAGLESLRWLMSVQTAPEGHFRPVGSESFGRVRLTPRAYDQQALESAATISACLAAWRIDKQPEWSAGATRAFDWFLGSNDLGMPLVDLETGSCRDGLHADRLNENRGAESVLSYLLGLVDIRHFSRAVMMDRKQPSVEALAQTPSISDSVPVRGIKPRAMPSYTRQGGHSVAIPVLESPGAASLSRPGPGRRQTI